MEFLNKEVSTTSELTISVVDLRLVDLESGVFDIFVPGENGEVDIELIMDDTETVASLTDKVVAQASPTIQAGEVLVYVGQGTYDDAPFQMSTTNTSSGVTNVKLTDNEPAMYAGAAGALAAYLLAPKF